MFDYDAELRLHNLHLRAAAAVGPHDRVLDIGSGTGQTTREAGRAAVSGSAFGVDIAAPMLERARMLSADLHNVSFWRADAQVYHFRPAHFDVCISRFGYLAPASIAAGLPARLARRPDRCCAHA